MKTFALAVRCATVCTVASFALACHDAAELTAPGALVARGASVGPTVKTVSPASSERGVTLDVTVSGSGFEKGSVVQLERAGAPGTGITTNSTTYVTSRKLVANVTIAAEADTGKYDVAVSSLGGGKGVGIELFEVVYEISELGIIGGTWSRAHAINDNGEVVGASCTGDCLSTAFYWSATEGQKDLGGLAGFSRSAAFAITNAGQVFGRVDCRPDDAGCGGVFKNLLVRWDRSGDGWKITPLQGCSPVSVPVSDNEWRILVNSREECVRRQSGSLSVQRLSAGAVIGEEQLPSLYADSYNSAYSMNEASMVAGVAHEVVERLSATSARLSQPQPVVWYRRADGTWAVVRLGFPATDLRAYAMGIADADSDGRVRVTGYTESVTGSGQTDLIRAMRWTLEPDGSGGLRVANSEILGENGNGRPDHRWTLAVNGAGDVVGISGQYVMTGSPIRWAIGGVAEVLPNATGGTQGRAMDINKEGWIVGAVWDSRNNCDRAAIWRQR